MKKISLVLFMSLLTSNAALACMGARLELNDDIVLTGSGVESKSDGVYDLNKLQQEKWIGIDLDASDSKKKVTHSFVVLGGTQDAGGIISMSYLVKDEKTREEKVYFMKNNYQGDGATAKGGLSTDEKPQPKQDADFKTLTSVGC